MYKEFKIVLQQLLTFASNNPVYLQNEEIGVLYHYLDCNCKLLRKQFTLTKTNKKKNILLNGQYIYMSFDLKESKKEKKEVLKHNIGKGSDYLS